jgi:alkanesulfonate monooxygenase SsuD/methylene tetrahydromethanopterin reductase-like flavin-dependent oxidoreductase (luciferase family)
MSLGDASFGISLPVFAGNSYRPGKVEQYYQIDYAYPLNGSFSWEQVEGLSKEAERLGYRSLWVSDHVMLGKANLEAWVTLSALAVATRKIRLGSFMSCDGYRNPALVAKMAATLGLVSSGRFVLGYGSGWYKPEFDAYGFPFPPLRDRVEQMEEGLRIIRGMFEEPVFSYQGRHYSVKDAVIEPKPPKGVPIFIGGGGKRTLRAVARFADGWDVGPDVTPERYRGLVARLKDELAKEGRRFEDVEKSVHLTVVIGKDEEELRTKKRILLDAVKDVDLSKSFRSGPGVFDIESTLIGTPSTIRERLGELAKLGCEHFVLMFMDYPRYDSPSLFAETVAT